MPLIYSLIYDVMYLALELGCAIVGCRLVTRSWARPYKALVVLFVVTFVVELGSGLLLFFKLDPLTAYVWLTPYETWTILYFFGATQSGRLLGRMHIFYAASMLILQPLYYYLHYPRDLVFQHLYLQAYFCFMLLLASCGALVQIVRGAVEAPISSHPVFWASIGMICYSTAFSILNVLGGLYAPKYLSAPFSLVGNTGMYGGFILCFIRYARLQRGLAGAE